MSQASRPAKTAPANAVTTVGLFSAIAVLLTLQFLGHKYKSDCLAAGAAGGVLGLAGAAVGTVSVAGTASGALPLSGAATGTSGIVPTASTYRGGFRKLGTSAVAATYRGGFKRL